MIENVGWRQDYRQDLEQRIAVAHKDLTKIAALLRNTLADVWTETPTDTTLMNPAKTAGSWNMEGWRVHFRGEFQRLQALNTANGAKLAASDPEGKAAMDGLLVSLPAIGVVLTTVRGRYLTGGDLIQRKVSQPDRNEIATAIEAELS